MRGDGRGACDGAGARRALRAGARDDERDLPGAGAALQRRGRRRRRSRGLGSALGGAAGAAARCEELAALVGVGRLRDHGVPREELAEVAAAVAVRPAALANPRPVDAAAVVAMLEEVW